MSNLTSTSAIIAQIALAPGWQEAALWQYLLCSLELLKWFLLSFALRIVFCSKRDALLAESVPCLFRLFDYSMTLAITPEPTVRPPSRIAKRRPCSMAMGVIRVISMSRLSPGITISTPSGSLMLPVTSVVRK